MPIPTPCLHQLAGCNDQRTPHSGSKAPRNPLPPCNAGSLSRLYHGVNGLTRVFNRVESAHLEGLSDEELLARHGDPAAFAEFYKRYSRPVFQFFCNRTASLQTAADLTSECFARAFAGRRTYKTARGSARTWLFAIARHELGRFVRRERVEARTLARLGVERIAVPEDEFERVEEMADLPALRGTLMEAITSIPRPHADAVLLRVGEGLPYSEVARRLGCTEGAARVRVARGLSQVFEKLETAE